MLLNDWIENIWNIEWDLFLLQYEDDVTGDVWDIWIFSSEENIHKKLNMIYKPWLKKENFSFERKTVDFEWWIWGFISI
jgi:hypothetical protein